MIHFVHGLALLTALMLTACEVDRPPPKENVPEVRVQPEEQRALQTPDPEPPELSGALSGRVVYHGPLPETTTMSIPEAGELVAHTIIVDPTTHGLANAVVWVEGPWRGAPVETLESVVLDQRNWTFLPHVLAIRAGQEVRMINSDVANHNIHSVSPGQEFNVGTPTDNMTSRRFRHATRTRPIHIECNIHDWMRAWIYVFSHDAFAVTDGHGRFHMKGVPVGTSRLHVHHADGSLHAVREISVEKNRAKAVEIAIE